MARDPSALVLVGASAGGLPALRRLLVDVPTGLPVALLAVVHLPSRPTLPLVDLLGDWSPWPVHQVGGRHRPRAGEVLVPPPDRHLVVGSAGAEASCLPPRGGVRPSVDLLFGSAADARGREVVAVVLSGGMRDGAAGAARVERAGGRVLVQDPCDATVTGMPSSALAATQAHVVAPASGLGTALRDLVDELLTARSPA